MSKLSIEFKPLAGDFGDAITRASFAEVVIKVGDNIVTELMESDRRREGVRVSTHVLAQWLLFNWWRLRWEPFRDTIDWRLSHNLATAGDGYIWPRLTMVSDNEYILMTSKSTSPTSQPIRYLNSLDPPVPVPVAEFEQAIDDFLENVLSMLSSSYVDAKELAELWKELQEERHNPRLRAFRKFEAMLGFDPGEASDSVIENLLQLGTKIGVSAVGEVAVDHGLDSPQIIDSLWDELRPSANTIRVSEVKSVRDHLNKEIDSTLLPWQKAVRAAITARSVWGVPSGPVSNSDLESLFSISQNVINGTDSKKAPMIAGFRNGNHEEIGVYLKSPFIDNRRFALLRLVGDHLTASHDDKLLPGSRQYTSRQKYQRAFAQEFLCPYNELEDFRKGEDINDDLIESAARHFQVSSWMIKTILVNKRVEGSTGYYDELVRYPSI